jgi:hypothetical protein
MKYKIFISAQPRAIVYTVSSYKRLTTENSDDIEFIDELTGDPVRTAWTNCIVREVQQ